MQFQLASELRVRGRESEGKGRREGGGGKEDELTHGRESEELNLRKLQSEKDGDRVVVTGITIEPDGEGRGHLES